MTGALAVNSDAIRLLVREVLAEELARLKRETGSRTLATPQPAVREEVVSVRNSAELMQFVRRLLEVTKDGRARQEIEAGRWVFRLAGGGSGSGTVSASTSTAADAGGSVTIEQGLISERQIDGMPKTTRRLALGRRARLTPLARDRVRQRGIEIERIG
jgi:hypothetical protein